MKCLVLGPETYVWSSRINLSYGGFPWQDSWGKAALPTPDWVHSPRTTGSGRGLPSTTQVRLPGRALPRVYIENPRAFVWLPLYLEASADVFLRHHCEAVLMGEWSFDNTLLHSDSLLSTFPPILGLYSCRSLSFTGLGFLWV